MFSSYRLYSLLTLIFVLCGCANSGYDVSNSPAPVTAVGATYQQEALPTREMTPAEKQAYLQRFTADMTRLQVQRDAERRREEQLEREAAARQEAEPAVSDAPAVIPGWNGTPPPASPPPPAYEGYADSGQPAMGGGFAPHYGAPASGFPAPEAPSGNRYAAPPRYSNSGTGGPVSGPIYRSSSGTAYTYPNQRRAPVAATQDDPNRVVYVTNTGSKFHAGGCRYLRRSENPIRWRDAVQGYEACSVCGGG